MEFHEGFQYIEENVNYWAYAWLNNTGGAQGTPDEELEFYFGLAQEYVRVASGEIISLLVYHTTIKNKKRHWVYDR